MAAILVNTGTLKGAIHPRIKKPGAFWDPIPHGVRVGYGGPDKHPKARLTIAKIASYHQEGGGSLPQRKIIVKPDGLTIKRMIDVMNKAIKLAAK